jgi:hypothetical protein
MNFKNITTKKKSPLKVLREKYPDEQWSAHRAGFGFWDYKTESGWNAHYVAAYSPRYDGDDENFVSQFWVYFNDKNRYPERAWGL